MRMAITLVLAMSLIEAAEHFETLEVVGKESSALESTTLIESAKRAQTTAGETLGDYLNDEPLVYSASYGAGVGRPVIKGLEGYRVGIVQGNTVLNDLSSMSQDHAVATNARLSQTIELISGAASLLYGSYAGGVVNIKGEEHQNYLLPQGLHGESFAAFSSNQRGQNYGATVEYGENNRSVHLSALYGSTQNYQAGGTETIAHSDTRNMQTHAVLGYKIDRHHILKLYGDLMQNDYGIPNTTQAATRIEMHQKRVGLVWHDNHPNETIEHITTEVQYSDYLHYETEDASNDGLFGQTQLHASIMAGFDAGAWHIDTHTTLGLSRLQVCHAHGSCTDFTDALRTSNPDGSDLLNNLNTYGRPFSHAHPMPDTTQTELAQSIVAKYLGKTTEWSAGYRGTVRHLKANPENIQESWLVTYDTHYYDAQNDVGHAATISTMTAGEKVSIQTSVGYIERLPSAQELFWNGFHHATDSYLFGDVHAKKERSIHIDAALLWTQGAMSTTVQLFYYRFLNYLYQRPASDANGTWITDPVHESLVWELEGTGAQIAGGALTERFLHEHQGITYEAGMRLEMLQGILDDGTFIPRMAPYSAAFDVGLHTARFESKLAYTYTDQSRHLAPLETATPAYGWLSLYLAWEKKMRETTMRFYLNGQNLTDAKAYNHLSFLKVTAPLLGRSITAGVSVKF